MQFLVRTLLIFIVLALANAAIAQDAAYSRLLAPPANAAPAPVDQNSEPWHPPGDAPAANAASAEITPEGPPSADDSNGELLPPLPEGAKAESLIDSSGAPTTWYQPTYWFGPSPWDTGVELGINGSAGTSDSMSLTTGGYIKRESRFSKLDLDIKYNRTTSGGVETQNNGQVDGRNDWLLDEKSPWTLFASGNIFYDEFQAFNLQTNANSGVGYRFFHKPVLELTGRLGAGASREIGGPDDDWVPESILGLEYSQKINRTQKLYGKVDYYPAWADFGDYRIVADTGWEIELVQPENLSLKISATDRYDSTPNGADPQLVNYSVLLLLKL